MRYFLPWSQSTFLSNVVYIMFSALMNCRIFQHIEQVPYFQKINLLTIYFVHIEQQQIAICVLYNMKSFVPTVVYVHTEGTVILTFFLQIWTGSRILMFTAAPISRTNAYSSCESVWFIFNLQENKKGVWHVHTLIYIYMIIPLHFVLLNVLELLACCWYWCELVLLVSMSTVDDWLHCLIL